MHFTPPKISTSPTMPRLATSRPLGERSEPFSAAKRPTASDEVAVVSESLYNAL